MSQGPELIHPVVAIARDAKAQGLPIAVASSGVKPTVTGHLRGHGILDLFDAVVTCEDVKHGKPAPDLYLLAAEKWVSIPRGAPRTKTRSWGCRARKPRG